MEELVEKFKTSGVSLARFCRENQACYWALRRRVVRTRPSPQVAKLTAVPLGSLLSTSWVAEIALPNGATVRLGDSLESDWVGQVLKAVARC